MSLTASINDSSTDLIVGRRQNANEHVDEDEEDDNAEDDEEDLAEHTAT